ncbi:Lytic transglycosylase, catalytic [Shewanella denitrificans OS217]|uniref:Lytic transglycosylase, catalytic n=1 Tax=Shewanella denitrificans (strain OS217 / ATCC BAA-1090 / DSM 15013) TaxID=318161 RepID=Q12I44_SHEDO|nr:Lytic transglycosylase, catalytic [Shewanella denitrificans OS217]
MVLPPKLFGLSPLILLLFIGMSTGLQAQTDPSQAKDYQAKWLTSLPVDRLSWARFSALPISAVVTPAVTTKSTSDIIFYPLEPIAPARLESDTSTKPSLTLEAKTKYNITLKPQRQQSINPHSAKPKIIARYSTQGTSKQLASDKDKVYHYTKHDGGAVFSDRAPEGGEYQVLLFECFACRLDSNLDWHKIPLFALDYSHSVAEAAKIYRLEPALIRAVIHAESAFDVHARSKAGAMGLMQLMPTTAADMGVTNAFNAQQNILGGSRYLAQMLKQFNGDIELACAAYNAGPTTVTQYRGIPPYPETQAYVKRVKILLQRYRNVSAS